MRHVLCRCLLLLLLLLLAALHWWLRCTPRLGLLQCEEGAAVG
jgi:hypothetical protein